jgi:4-hydroxy-3-methylbut-2-enyl diphosphate reductase
VLVNEVLAHLQPRDGIAEFSVTFEDEYFPPPPELREVLKALTALVDVLFATPVATDFDAQADREFTATEVISA